MDWLNSPSLFEKDMAVIVEALYWSAYTLEEKLSDIPEIREKQKAEVIYMRELRKRIKKSLREAFP
jgi:hypothetical protein